MAGMGALWSYFPHFVDARVGGLSLADKLRDRAVLSSIAEKTARYCIKHEGGRVSRNRAVQSLKAYCGHHVSNFRPTAARDLVRRFGGSSASVFDPCGGWGGRMLGASAAGPSRFVCVDASEKTASGLARLAKDLSEPDFLVSHAAVEDWSLADPGRYDLAMTSPPYFNAEVYSDDPEQSCHRYVSWEVWLKRFLEPMVGKMREAVGVGGFVAVNVSDYRGLPLVTETRGAMSRLGLSDEGEVAYVVSSISGRGEKSEPILIGRTLKPRHPEGP